MVWARPSRRHDTIRRGAFRCHPSGDAALQPNAKVACVLPEGNSCAPLFFCLWEGCGVCTCVRYAALFGPIHGASFASHLGEVVLVAMLEPDDGQVALAEAVEQPKERRRSGGSAKPEAKTKAAGDDPKDKCLLVARQPVETRCPDKADLLEQCDEIRNWQGHRQRSPPGRRPAEYASADVCARAQDLEKQYHVPRAG